MMLMMLLFYEQEMAMAMAVSMAQGCECICRGGSVKRLKGRGLHCSTDMECIRSTFGYVAGKCKAFMSRMGKRKRRETFTISLRKGNVLLSFLTLDGIARAKHSISQPSRTPPQVKMRIAMPSTLHFGRSIITWCLCG